MRFAAALTGSLREAMAAERAAGERAVADAMRQTAEGLKADLRAETARAGLGQRLARAWRSNAWPKSGGSLDAAAMVWSNAPKLHGAFSEGVTIRSKDGFFLAIPTEAARGRYRNRAISPSNWPDHRFGKLRFVYRASGPSLLVADGLRARTGKRGGFGKAGKRAAARGETATAIMFLLVPQARLRKRLSFHESAARWGASLPDRIVANWEREARDAE